ncbi:Syntaxin-binding protein 5-like [Smittium mucronatum]|uniref:Syntaxin-binding protein 5-like n=1 Tax=Smittium mucronatum TaxID=133383 RepID=A0A1R0H0B8_9FUNG|nr:Syntaxin-binding protein 5-like [Smittium mucronatum]
MDVNKIFSKITEKTKIVDLMGLPTKSTNNISVSEEFSEELFNPFKTFELGFNHKPVVTAYDQIQRIYAVGTDSGTIKLYGRPGIYSENGKFDLPQAVPVIFLKFLTGKPILISADTTNTIVIFDTFLQKPCAAYTTPARITSIEFISNSEWLLVSQETGRVYIFDVVNCFKSDFSIPYCGTGKGQPIVSMRSHPRKHEKLLIGYLDGQIIEYDFSAPNSVKRFSSLVISKGTFDSDGYIPILTDLIWCSLKTDSFIAAFSDGLIVLCSSQKDVLLKEFIITPDTVNDSDLESSVKHVNTNLYYSNFTLCKLKNDSFIVASAGTEQWDRNKLIFILRSTLKFYEISFELPILNIFNLGAPKTDYDSTVISIVFDDNSVKLFEYNLNDIVCKSPKLTELLLPNDLQWSNSDHKDVIFTKIDISAGVQHLVSIGFEVFGYAKYINGGRPNSGSLHIFNDKNSTNNGSNLKKSFDCENNTTTYANTLDSSSDSNFDSHYSAPLNFSYNHAFAISSNDTISIWNLDPLLPCLVGRIIDLRDLGSQLNLELIPVRLDFNFKCQILAIGTSSGSILLFHIGESPPHWVADVFSGYPSDFHLKKEPRYDEESSSISRSINSRDEPSIYPPSPLDENLHSYELTSKNSNDPSSDVNTSGLYSNEIQTHSKPTESELESENYNPLNPFTLPIAVDRKNSLGSWKLRKDSLIKVVNTVNIASKITKIITKDRDRRNSISSDDSNNSLSNGKHSQGSSDLGKLDISQLTVSDQESLPPKLPTRAQSLVVPEVNIISLPKNSSSYFKSEAFVNPICMIVNNSSSISHLKVSDEYQVHFADGNRNFSTFYLPTAEMTDFSALKDSKIGSSQPETGHNLSCSTKTTPFDFVYDDKVKLDKESDPTPLTFFVSSCENTCYLSRNNRTSVGKLDLPNIGNVIYISSVEIPQHLTRHHSHRMSGSFTSLGESDSAHHTRHMADKKNLNNKFLIFVGVSGVAIFINCTNKVNSYASASSLGLNKIVSSKIYENGELIFLQCLDSDGFVAAISIPNLRSLSNNHVFPEVSNKIINSKFTSDGRIYLNLSTNQILMYNIFGERGFHSNSSILFDIDATEEAIFSKNDERKPFWKKIIDGGGAFSKFEKNNRNILLPNAGPPGRYSTASMRSDDRRKDKSAGGPGNEGQSSKGNFLTETTEKLKERGEKLNQVNESTAKLQNAASDFLSDIRDYNRRMEKKKWYEL